MTLTFKKILRGGQLAGICVLFAIVAIWEASAVVRWFGGMITERWTDVGMFTCSMYFMVFFAHVVLLPGNAWRAGYAIAGGSLELFRLVMFSDTEVSIAWSHGMGLGLGMGAIMLSLVRLAYMVAFQRGTHGKEINFLLRLLFWTMATAPSYDIVGLTVTHSTSEYNFDGEVYLIDLALGANFSGIAASVFEEGGWLLRKITFRVYSWLPGAIVFVYMLQMLCDREQGRHVILSSALMACCSVFYMLVPVVGPAALFWDAFPYHMPAAKDVDPHALRYLASDMIHNAMPSLHTGWALLLVLHSQKLWLWARVLMLLFLGFTLFATLATGNHYLIDLIVAFPMTLAVYALTCAVPGGVPRWKSVAHVHAAVIGAMLTALWLMLIRLRAEWLYGITGVAFAFAVLTMALFFVFLAPVLQSKKTTP